MHRLSRRPVSLVLAAGAAVGGLASSAMAQVDPPDMTAVEWPIDTGSIATVVAAAGAAILLLVFGTGIGFSLIKKLFARLKGTI